MFCDSVTCISVDRSRLSSSAGAYFAIAVGWSGFDECLWTM